jgi:HSP20 family molecular chaperone IbpA
MNDSEPSSSTPVQQTNWLGLGVFLLALLFTPLGGLWWLAIIVIALLAWTKTLRSETAFLWAGVALAGGILTAGQWNAQTLSPTFRNEASDTQSMDWNGIQRLEVRGFNGAIRINSVRSAQNVRFERKGGATISVERSGDTMRVTAKRPFFSFSSSVDITLDIPEDLSIRIENSNGGIRAEGRIRELEARTSNGRVELRDTGKISARLETNNAEIVVERVGGTLKATTANNAIRATELSDVQLDLATSNASIRLERVALANNTRSKVMTNNGGITIEGISAPSGLSLRGSTSNARVDVQLSGFDVQLEDERFTARKEGFGQAELELSTSNDRITVR